VEVRIKNLESATSTPLAYVTSEIPAIEGFGPVTGGLGMKNEFIVRDSLIDRSVLLAYVMFKTYKNFK
jgi:D-alanine-D-alanine ligase